MCGRSRAARNRSQLPGDFFEYTIGAETVVIVRAGDGALHAFYNTCLHRGRRLADGCGSFADGAITCPYHGWCYALDGRLVDVPDREEFAGLPDDLALAPVRLDTWGGFVFLNLDAKAEPLLDFLDPLPELLGAVSPRADATPRFAQHDHRRELEGGRRRVQRGLPRTRTAPADPALDRRRQHRIRTARQALALRAPPRRAAPTPTEPTPTSRSRRLRRGRDPRQPRRRARRRVPRRGARGDRSLAGDRPATGEDLARGVPSAAHATAVGARLRRVGSLRRS